MIHKSFEVPAPGRNFERFFGLLVCLGFWCNETELPTWIRPDCHLIKFGVNRRLPIVGFTKGNFRKMGTYPREMRKRQGRKLDIPLRPLQAGAVSKEFFPHCPCTFRYLGQNSCVGGTHLPIRENVRTVHRFSLACLVSFRRRSEGGVAKGGGASPEDAQ